MAEIEDGVSFRWAHAGRICRFAGSWRGKLEKIGVQVVSFLLLLLLSLFDMFAQPMFATLSDIVVYFPTDDIDAAKQHSPKFEEAIKKVPGTSRGSKKPMRGEGN